MIMRDTIFCAIPADADRDAIAASIKQMAAEVAAYVPGYRLRHRAAVRRRDPDERRAARVAIFLEVEGAGDFLPPYVGQPRHHDRRRHQGRRRARHARSWPNARKGDLIMSYSADLDVRITDSSLRDGSHAIGHQFTVEQRAAIVAALDGAGVPVIEVTHGDGLGGSSFNYGFSAVPDERPDRQPRSRPRSRPRSPS